jgi:hypothetical protein
MPRKSYPGTVAVIGGAGLLAWWLLRGQRGTTGSERAASRPCRMHVDASGLRLDGEAAELTSAVAACRAAGAADVTASGDAVVGVIAELLAALQAAGVVVRADPDIWQVTGGTPVRNGSLTYRPVGKRGEPYPGWVRDLKGKSGVYVIREGGQVVYVGESHANRLYDTLTRHFQTWRRWKGFWKGQYAEGHDPGLTYDRHKVDVAVRTTSPEQALHEEVRLIQRLKPRDNLLGQAELDDVPF